MPSMRIPCTSTRSSSRRATLRPRSCPRSRRSRRSRCASRPATGSTSRMHAKEALRAQYDAATRARAGRAREPAAERLGVAGAIAPSSRPASIVAARQILIDNKVARRARGLSRRDAARACATAASCSSIAAGSRSGHRDRMLPQAPPPAGEVTVRGRIAIPPARLPRAQAATSPAVRCGRTSIPRASPRRPASPCCRSSSRRPTPPVPDDGLVRAWPAPDFGVETHRIYMVQWYAFALLAALLWLWFHRPRAGAPRDG